VSALEGIRVLDLSRLLPGGYGTSLLADLGAEVIKVEQPGAGDYMRWYEPHIDGESAASWVVDRNKSSIALDLKDPEDRQALLELVRTADAVVESFRPGVMDRLRIGYETLREHNAAIVLCSISGYGQDGPLRLQPGHDINYLGRAGVLSVTGSADGVPVVPGVQLGDIAGGGLLGMVGLLAALVRARATGEGDHVDVSMADGAFSCLSIHLGDYFATGHSPGPEGMLLNGAFPCYRVYRCADGGHVTVGAIEPQFWTALCDGVGRPDLLESRMDASAIGLWDAVFATEPRDHWVRLLGGTCCVGPVNDFAEACADPQLQARDMVVELATRSGAVARQVGQPIKLRNAPASVRSPAPRLGADGERVLGRRAP
jgi:alpha-methylacyl-CoA racemase